MAKSQTKEPSERFSDALLQISKRANTAYLPFPSFLNYVLKKVAEALKVGRSSYWTYETDSHSIRCTQSRQLNPQLPSAVGQVLGLANHPLYFQKVSSSRSLAANDLRTDAVGKSFAEMGYTENPGIRSMLDVAVWHKKELLGILCVEEPVPRTWNAEESAFIGSVGELLGLAFALGESERLRQKLEASEEHYRQLFELNPSAIAVYDTESLRFLDINRAGEKLLAYKRAEMIGQPLSQYLSPASLPLFEKQRPQAISSEPLETGPWLVKKGDGKEIYVRTRSHQMPFEGRKARAVLLCDITLQEKSQRSLKAHLNALGNIRRAISNSFLMLMVDVKGYILEANNAFCQHLGYSFEELSGKRARHLTDKSDYTRSFWQAVDVKLDTDGFWSGELRLCAKQGGGHWMVVYLNTILDEKGQIEKVLCLMYPIDQRKEMEQQRDELIDDLLTRNQHLRTFTHLTSHHIRQPISRLLGLVELMEFPQRASEEQQLLWEYIQQSVDELDGIVADLNEVLELRTDEHFAQVGLPGLFATSKELLQPLLQKIKPVIELQLELLEVVSIPSFMENIFFQLLENALKFRDPDRRLKLRITSHEEDDDRWCLCFEDNGLGIDLERYENDLFKMYQRFHPWIPGKGLGLFTINRQVEMLGGRIRVEQSSVGKGLCIRLSFPKHL